MRPTRWAALLVTALWMMQPSMAPAHVSPTLTLDRELLDLVNRIESGQIEHAEQLADRLIVTYPGSRAVQLLYADLHNIRAGRPVSMAPQESYSRQMLEVLSELKSRRAHAADNPLPGHIPANILAVRAETRHVIAVDLSRSRLYLLERLSASEPFSVREHHYVSIGQGGIGKVFEGDLKTPVGIYRIDGFREDAQLPPLYGAGAFTLNFPNALDQQNGFDGTGIWLHGVPRSQLSRPPLSSEGCVVMRNALIEHLLNIIDRDNTPVLLASHLSWVRPGDYSASAESLLSMLRGEPAESAPPSTGARLLALAGDHIKGLFSEPTPTLDTSINADVFVYPEHPNVNASTPVYQVSFLHSNQAEAGSTLITEYWHFAPSIGWSRVLDTPK
ncbi:MAG TPA: hypothetical protein DD979_02570 [Gammaproteobacteria bacterium]|nr:hypothetical protein [Gammaproteobacteria bacterium]